jgi:hypothetical protein
MINFAKLLLESTVHHTAHQCTTFIVLLLMLYTEIFLTIFYIKGSSILGCYVTSTDKQLMKTQGAVQEQYPLFWSTAVLKMEALHSPSTTFQKPRINNNTVRTSVSLIGATLRHPSMSVS